MLCPYLSSPIFYYFFDIIDSISLMEKNETNEKLKINTFVILKPHFVEKMVKNIALTIFVVKI